MSAASDFRILRSVPSAWPNTIKSLLPSALVFSFRPFHFSSRLPSTHKIASQPCLALPCVRLAPAPDRTRALRRLPGHLRRLGLLKLELLPLVKYDISAPFPLWRKQVLTLTSRTTMAIRLWGTKCMTLPMKQALHRLTHLIRTLSTSSVSSSILHYRTIQGRTYHSDRFTDQYFTPNDDKQQQSIDIM